MTKIRGHQIPYFDKAVWCIELFCYVVAGISTLLYMAHSLYMTFGAILAYMMMGRALNTLRKIDFTQDAQMFYLMLGVPIGISIMVTAVVSLYGVISFQAAMIIWFFCAIAMNISAHMALKGGET